MSNRLNIIIISFFLLSCGKTAKNEVKQENTSPENEITLTADQVKNAGIVGGKLLSKSISSTLKLNGKIDVPPQSLVSVSVPLGGYLKSTNLMPGMHVKKGETIAVMEDAQYIQLQQDYLTAKAQLVVMEMEFNRQKELNQNKASSDKIFEQSRANYQTQLILIKSLEEKLKLIGFNPHKLSSENISNSISVPSPINGFVSAVNVNIGKYVNPSEVLFELVNPSDIHLALTVFEKDIDKLSIGQKLIAFNNSNPQKKYKCEIILMSKNLANDHALLVHCHFDEYDAALIPGMFMTAEVKTNDKQVLALPDAAVVRYQNRHYVFVIKGNQTFEMKQVALGNNENGFTEIICDEGLKKEEFVTEGAYNLLMALKNKGND